MKNLKIKNKLMISFMAVALLALISGIFSIVGLSTLSKNEDEMHLQSIIADDATQLWRNVQAQRAAYRGAALKYYINQDFSGDISDLNALDTEFIELFNHLKESIVLEENKVRLDEISAAYEKYKSDRNLFVASIGTNNASQLAELFTNMVAPIELMVNRLELLSKSAIDRVADTAQSDSKTAAILITITGILVALAVASALFFAFYISNMINKPLSGLTEFMEKASLTGDISFSTEDLKRIKLYGDNKDEIGQCINSASHIFGHLDDVSKTLEQIANGDMTVSMSLLSDSDVIGLSLTKMVNNLNQMFVELQSSSEQVFYGSKQIAEGAQDLALGATNQAAAVQELSASITNIAEKTKLNTSTIIQTANLADEIKVNAEEGSEKMSQLMDAVNEIDAASKRISKVIKAIDDIAFQTNILALNAAVEAARAGQQGKGFAVVASEVRDLATKSLVAAKDTSNIIADSIEKSELGTRIAEATATSLTKIVSGINNSNDLMKDIAKISEEQSEQVQQINKGIDQVAQVVQQNTATAQEAAASSQEMSGQANMLRDMASRFKLRNHSANQNNMLIYNESNSNQYKRGYKNKSKSNGYDEVLKDDFGKY